MKRHKPAAPKDPLRKEYSTLQNMVYIIKGTFRYQKPLLFFFPAAILMSVINSYLPTFALSIIIDRVTAECTPSQLLLTVAAFFGVLLLVMALQTFADANIGWRMYHARIKIMMWRIRKVLYMDDARQTSCRASHVIRFFCHRLDEWFLASGCVAFLQFSREDRKEQCRWCQTQRRRLSHCSSFPAGEVVLRRPQTKPALLPQAAGCQQCHCPHSRSRC